MLRRRRDVASAMPTCHPLQPPGLLVPLGYLQCTSSGFLRVLFLPSHLATADSAGNSPGQTEQGIGNESDSHNCSDSPAAAAANRSKTLMYPSSIVRPPWQLSIITYSKPNYFVTTIIIQSTQPVVAKIIDFWRFG